MVDDAVGSPDTVRSIERRSDPTIGDRRRSRTETTPRPTPTMTYRLTCTDCTFERVMDVDVDVDDVYDVIEDHQSEYEADPADHFVNFERLTDAAES